MTGGFVGLGLYGLTRRSKHSAPVEPGQRSAIEVAKGEVAAWRGLTETDAAARPMLDKYWGVFNISQDPSVAWSAAWMSWVHLNSEHPNALQPSQSHYWYAVQAARDIGKPGRFGALRLDEARPLQKGDILLRNRAGSTLTFADLEHATGYQPSHGDLVTADESRGRVDAIGGNVDQGVRERSLALNDPAIFAVLRYQPESGNV